MLFKIACVILFALPCAAQNVAGSIFGTVQDTSGQAAPGAAVTITNEATASSLKENSLRARSAQERIDSEADPRFQLNVTRPVSRSRDFAK